MTYLASKHFLRVWHFNKRDIRLRSDTHICRKNAALIQTTRACLQAVCLVFILPWCSYSVAAPSVDFTPDNRREYVAKLAQAAFAQIAKNSHSELQARYPEHSRVSVYIYLPGHLHGNDINLQSLKVSMNGQHLAEYSYTAAEVAALQNTGRQRILRTNVTAFSEPLLVEFSGTQQRSKQGETRVQGAVRLTLEANQVPRALVVPITTDAIGKTLPLKAAQTQAHASGKEDPRLGMATFLRAAGDTYAALEELLAINIASTDRRALTPAYYLALAGSYLDFGMRAQAVDSMRKALGAGANKVLVNDVSLRLAELDFNRRYYARAYNFLQFLSSQNLTPSQKLRWQDLQSRLLMSAGQYDQACEALASGEEKLETLTDADHRDPLRMYMRFNYAICLIKTDEIRRGWWLMERIGRIENVGDNLAALRDRANLLLGYNFLATAQGGLVKEVMQRVRLQGPFRAEALLALGWMELAWDGITPSNPQKLGGRAEQSQSMSKHVTAALKAWQETVKSFPLDAAAQEAIVGIAFVKGQLGEKPAALSAYQDAVTTLERSHKTLTDYVKNRSVDMDQLALGKPEALPNAAWAARALASNEFQEHLQNYRLLTRLQKESRRFLDTPESTEITALSNAAPSSASQQRQPLQRLVSNLDEQVSNEAMLAHKIFDEALAKQIKTLEKYIVAARFGVAVFEAQ